MANHVQKTNKIGEHHSSSLTKTAVKTRLQYCRQAGSTLSPDIAQENIVIETIADHYPALFNIDSKTVQTRQTQTNLNSGLHELDF
jgi:hypothetical protein